MSKLEQKQQSNKKIVLRSYQADIIKQATKAKGSVLVELPTGGGIGDGYNKIKLQQKGTQ